MMQECLHDLIPPIALTDRSHHWWWDVPAGKFLEDLFREYFRRRGLPNLMNKSDYHEIVNYLSPERVPEEVRQKLDAIQEVAERARPVSDADN